MAEEAHSSPSSSSAAGLHSKIRIKSDIPDLSNLTATVTEVKRGGWFMTDNLKIGRPIRARECDVADDVAAEKEGAAGIAKKGDDDDDDEEEEESHSSAGDKDSDEGSDKEEEDTDNYDKDQFLKLGTTIKITSGEHTGRICTISERRVGIFLKISVNGDIRLMQPDEIEVIEFAYVPPADNEEEEQKIETKEKDFGHKKYIGATVRVGGVAVVPSGRKQRAKAIVDKAFSGEWYLVSDPDIVKALDPAQFEVVKDGDGGSGGGKGGGKRKRDNDDEKEEGSLKDTRRTRSSPSKLLYSDSESEEEEEEEEEGDDDFLSDMQYCRVVPESPETKKSLRKRGKKVNYAVDVESSDSMESWEDSDEDKDEEKGQEEEEVEEIVDDDDGDDVASVESERKPASTNPAPTNPAPTNPAQTNPIVDLTETPKNPKAEKVDNAKSDGDAPKATVNSSDDDGDIKMEEEPVTAAPVILHPKKADNNKVELLLSGISHLTPDTKIEVFNRKTGRVMRGDEAILLQDLPEELLNHAEYEPIVPTPQASTGNIEADEKKAAAEEDLALPVEPDFNPYDNSVLIGVTAFVKNGPYKGLTGKIKEIQERGRWLIDHEAITTTLRSSDCHFVDDGNVDKGAIAAHFKTKKKTPMPSFVKPGAVKVGASKGNTAGKDGSKVRRVGRTDTNVRVSNVVLPQSRPQTRVRASAVEGKRILVTKGEFRGLSGTISSCIPGGWYLISNLHDDEHELDVLIHSEKLELINNVSSQILPMLGHTHERIKSRIHLKASELRLSALKEKKQKISESATDTDIRTMKHLEEIETEMKSLTAKIVAFRQNNLGTSS